MALNRLAGETSPYLLQHAGNPVDWYPWGPEALERARSEDRPIFLSIGYSACHWCHVMERESFENPAIAAQLNAGFVAIKVDREERPDLDDIYMAAVQAMVGRGGWPMSVFLTPELRPFYGGTYYPAERRHGMPSFPDVLEAVDHAWHERREEIERSSRLLADAVAAEVGSAVPVSRAASATSPVIELQEGEGAEDLLRPGPRAGTTKVLNPLSDRMLLDAAVASLRVSFDAVNGGWGTAPKFPQPMAIEFLLRRAAVGEDAESLAMALRSLDAMAAGGIHDQVGGGFHRYATDAVWLVPHFEKMLSDNAQLSRAYLHAYQLTGERPYREVAGATLDYVRRELRVVTGAFAASQDADTAGVEGATFVWTLDEIRAELGSDASLFAEAYGVTEGGNWEGRTVLARVVDDRALAARFDMGPDKVSARLAAAREALREARARRQQPGRDDKVLTAWNGLMVAAFADGARILGRSADADAAVSAAEALLGESVGEDGRVRRSWRAGRPSPTGYLEDYADLAEGLLALYELTFDERWFVRARSLMGEVLARFADPVGGYFDTADDHERLLVRPKRLEDGATPSGNAMTTTVLLRLAAWTGDTRYRRAAEEAIRLVLPLVTRHPTAFGQWLIALDLALEPLDEVAIVGDPSAPETRALLDVAMRPYRPHQVVAASSNPGASAIELMQSRFAMQGRPTAFVCRDFACRQPVTEPAALGALLGG